MSRWNRLLLVLLSALALAGCEDNRVDAPLDQAEMQALMLDLYIVEKGLGVQYPRSPETRDSVAGVLYGKTFAYHNTDTAEVLSSLRAYMQRPDVLKEMHLELLGEFSYIEARLSNRPAKRREAQPPEAKTPAFVPMTPEEQRKQREKLKKLKQQQRKPKPER